MKCVYFVFGRDTRALREHKVSRESLVHQELMGYQASQGKMDEMEARGRKVTNTSTLIKLPSSHCQYKSESSFINLFLKLHTMVKFLLCVNISINCFSSSSSPHPSYPLSASSHLLGAMR
jgi:hypothetical protein